MVRHSIITLMLTTFFVTSLGPIPEAKAQVLINLPAPGLMVHRSQSFQPSQLKGIQVHADNPMRFEFLVDKGNSGLMGQDFKDEVTRLTKYFLTCLTVPESDLWVNLSPYEKDRIAPDHLGTTQLGKDLLEQDYLLKQVVASISYPEQKLGARFWQRVHQKAYELYGTTEIPSSTFNKVWIVPKSADVYVRGDSAFVVNSTLDVMLEADYLALSKNSSVKSSTEYSKAYTEVFREVILPELRIEVNKGKNFALLRQMYDAMILAAWYKRHLRDSFLGKKYVGQNKVNGVNLEDNNVKERIFQQYLASFKKRVYSYIREDYDPLMQKTIPRKYVSGGMDFANFGVGANTVYKEKTDSVGIRLSNDLAMATVDLSPVRKGLPKLAMTTAIALLAGSAFFGGSANAAVFSANPNGSVDVTVQQGDTYGAILQQMGAAIQGVNKAAYDQHVLSGKLWGEQGVVKKLAGTQDVKLKDGQKINIPVQLPAKALSALQKNVETSVAASTLAATPVPASTMVESPIEPDNTSTLALAVGLGLGAVGSRKYLRKKTVTTKVDQVKRVVVPAETKPVIPDVVNNTIEDDLKAIQVLSGDASTETELKLSLKGIQALHDNYVHPSSTPAEAERVQLSGWVRNLFVVFDYLNLGVGLAAFGGMFGFDQWQTYALATSMTLAGRGFLGLHIANHETAHAVAAAPWGMKTALSGQNLRGNLTAKTWRKVLTPFTKVQEDFNPKVKLPKAASEGYPKTFVEAAGFTMTSALALGGAFALGISAASGNAISQVLLFPWSMASALVVAGSFWTDILNKSPLAKAVVQCGIVGVFQAVPTTGILKSTLAPWLHWLTKTTEFLTDRGGQQAGVSSMYTNTKGNVVLALEKTLKSKRGFGSEGVVPVFYRNMIQDLYGRFNAKLPKFIMPVDNFGRPTIFGNLAHVRFATGGELVENAAHPHASAMEKKLIWAFDASAKLISKVIDVVVAVGHNGDNDGAKVGIPSKAQMFHSYLDVSQMRRIFPALVHKYYEGKVTTGYLKQNVYFDMHEDDKQLVAINVKDILKALRKANYILPNGRVNRTFKGLDVKFKNQFRGYSEKTFSRIESALYDLPPGDSPIIPLQIHLYMTQGNWDASARYAHVMVNHQNTKELMDDVLFEKEEQSVGKIFSDVFGQVEKYISLRSFVPKEGSYKSLKDLWVKDQETADRLGISDQYRILQTFKDMLIKSMKVEAQKNTVAGEVFRGWEARWKAQGLDVDHMRQVYVETMTEKFFTADREAAVQEFASRAEGTYGIFVRTSVHDDGVTVYSDNQDIAIGRNKSEGVLSFASDPRVLKTVGSDGKQMEEVMHLKDGEIVDMTFGYNNVINIKSYQKSKAGWKVAKDDALEHRFYPTANVVDGKVNPYYASTPVEYKNPRIMVKTDLENTSKIIAEAKEAWDQPASFNAQTSRYLAERLKNIYEKTGKARLVIIGYDNSETLSKNFKAILAEFIPNLTVDVIDANEFDANPKKFKINKDTVSLIVSKSGATFSTKLAANILKSSLPQENLFCMTARIDSVLNTVIGQGLRPEDSFTRRIFITGEFYPSEAPVASELLLLYQLNQTAFNLAKHLRQLTWSNNMFAMPLNPEAIKGMHERFEQHTMEIAQQFTGFDKNGEKSADAWGQKLRKTGSYLGNVFFETFFINRIMDAFVFMVLQVGSPVALLFPDMGPMIDFMTRSIDFVLIRYIAPWGFTEIYRHMIGRPANGRLGSPKLFIAGESIINLTQRNFMSRLFSNSLASTAPSAQYHGDTTSGFVTKHAHDVNRGDLVLNVALEHKISKDNMSVRQSVFPKTGAFFGSRLLAGRGQPIYVPIEIPRDSNASESENNIVDATSGMFALMLAYKVIGVNAVMKASMGGVLWNPAYTFSRAGVHTTPTPVAVNDEVREIIETGKKVANYAMSATPKGGIDLNSRLLKMNIKQEGKSQPRFHDKAWDMISIDGLTPNVGQIVPVTPSMLQSLLGQSSLN